ncbi:hypothetical protein BAUCODRAFT_67516 [Baudoinia panamericana UAMH 10762]|uniref:ER transporter 6TM N-terminal domain-containing protein n=1 Tax=Baudoinia panamericana (strain UAMH 10762) TaxID=717646 RepID=M2LTJ1_BAUPA|nr:uncharacterized protein BAUCODRAFT_67516 [Baudoinia panamericana UAMH 10762]EMC97852.1 hypothetical protein BAUCODRAFT_67516 [Baudoinia panamericana UAMH 10762]
MFKGAIAPVIATAAYQATPWAETYTTIGYLVGIMTILSLPIQPRAKFIQTMLVNIFVTLLGTAVALLAMLCTVRARINSEGYPTAPYNSSASAVAGLFLFAEIYLISVWRAKMPQFTIPSIILAIFANVSMIYAPQFSSMVQAEAFAQRLLEAFLTGFAISTGVSLLVFPLTSRQVVLKELTGYIGLLRASLKANIDYIHSLENADMFSPHRVNTAGQEVAGSKEADAFKAKMQALAALHSKFTADVPFAKREIAIGTLGADDMQQLAKHIRMVMLPTLGLSSLSDVFQRIAEQRGWAHVEDATSSAMDTVDENQKARLQSIEDWHELAKRLRDPFDRITQLNDEGLEHAAIVLRLAARRKARSAEDSVENGGDEPQPGEKGFAAYYDRRSQRFLDSKKEVLKLWCATHGIHIPANFFDDPSLKDFEAPAFLNEAPSSSEAQRLRRQLFLFLHMEFLLFNVNRQVYNLILCVDKLEASGKVSKNRLHVPGYKRLKKWLFTTFAHGGEAHDDQQIDTDANVTTVYLGDAYQKKKDPEHLPPQNLWERYSDSLRGIAHFFASPASSFGFRVACATMSIAIVAYLQNTQSFFTRERLFWAQIMISISMSPSAGQSVRSFFLRVFGTFAAMVLSYIAYYIVDGKTAGVIVFYFIFLHGGVYIVLKYPAFIPVGMISQVTMTLILGYELQVRKIGVQVAESNGQAYWPVYILAPVRLATVAGGLFLAWIWTIWPYPVAEYSLVRQNLAKTFYLLANYYSTMHETVRTRLRGCEGDVSDPNSPGYKLEKARHKVFGKCNAILSGLRAQAGFVKFDLPIGGRFPREKYQELIGLSQSALNFMALVSLASGTFQDLHQRTGSEEEHDSQWLRDFRQIVRQTNVTSEAITTLLSLLSASLANGSPLPPYLHVPEPFQLSQRLDELDKDILSIRHIAEPGYSSFAVIQIATRCVIDDLRKILKGVKDLVGELDFSFHVVAADSQESIPKDSLNNRQGRKLD